MVSPYAQSMVIHSRGYACRVGAIKTFKHEKRAISRVLAWDSVIMGATLKLGNPSVVACNIDRS